MVAVNASRNETVSVNVTFDEPQSGNGTCGSGIVDALKGPDAMLTCQAGCCVEGSCDCIEGYYGERCQAALRCGASVDSASWDFDACATIEIPEEMLDQALDSSGSKKKDETFRANTSMTKLESLMGKEFKHPRRKCQICGYSVSYSNFKRHMRNAHPNELGEDPSMADMGDMGGVEGVEMGMMGHHMDDSDRMSYNASAGGGEETDNVELVDGYVECKRCGDHVMKEFLGSHMRMEHGESEAGNIRESSPRDIIMRACPECGIEMRSDSIIKHCKMKHKVGCEFISQICLEMENLFYICLVYQL